MNAYTYFTQDIDASKERQQAADYLRSLQPKTGGDLVVTITPANGEAYTQVIKKKRFLCKRRDQSVGKLKEIIREIKRTVRENKLGTVTIIRPFIHLTTLDLCCRSFYIGVAELYGTNVFSDKTLWNKIESALLLVEPEHTSKSLYSW